MEAIREPIIPSVVTTTLEGALSFAHSAGYPVIVRPAFTLGGTGGGIAVDEAQLRQIASAGLRLSPITQILVEKCISGWKEIEFEVIRDSKGNIITVCSMENVDPVGVHTGRLDRRCTGSHPFSGRIFHAAQGCSEHRGGAGCRRRL